METKAHAEFNFGGSLPVANVQALAAECLTDNPPRYLRLLDELGQVWSTGSIILIIDMSKLSDGHMGSDIEMEKLQTASKEWGFFKLMNNGITEEVIRNMGGVLQAAHGREDGIGAITEQYRRVRPSFCPVRGLETGLWRHGLPLSAASFERNFRFWPNHPASFRATLAKYSSELVQVELSLLRAMAKNLRVDPGMFASLFEGGIQGIRTNYYPPCPQVNRVSGLTPHSDTSSITLLLQTSDVDGPQIKKNGKWLPIKPVPGALVVNVRDVIKIMSNVEYKSREHRAMVNPEKERLSIAAFHSIKLEGTVGPLPDFV